MSTKQDGLVHVTSYKQHQPHHSLFWQQVWCGLTSEGELIAVKQIELTTTDRRKAEHEYEKVQEEVELLKTLNHTNIVGSVAC